VVQLPTPFRLVTIFKRAKPHGKANHCGRVNRSQQSQIDDDVQLRNGSSQAIWQSKVPPDVQGRVFATRTLIASLVAPITRWISGPLADKIFEPVMQPDGSLAAIFGKIVGVGPGAGIGLMYVLCEIGALVIPLIGYTIPMIRNVEDIVPDYDVEENNSVVSQ